MRREVVEDGAVCSEPQVRSMDCHGNSSVGVNEKQRSDPATVTSVNKLLFLCPLIVQALILESCSFNVDSLLFLSFLSLHFSPPPTPVFTFLIPNLPSWPRGGFSRPHRLIMSMEDTVRHTRSPVWEECSMSGRKEGGPEGGQTH